MTITKSDVKLMAAERLNDDPDGGGYMTANTINDGVENNLFPDISGLDRAQGAVDYRKSFGAVLTADTDTYLGAHVLIDLIPADENVSGLLVPAQNASEVRSQLIDRLNSAASSDATGGTAFRGTKPLAVAASVADRSIKIDGVSIPFVPVTEVSAPVTGKVTAVAGESPSLIPALVPLSGTESVEKVGDYAEFFYGVVPGTVSGTFTAVGGASGALDDTLDDGVPYLTWNGMQDDAPLLPGVGGAYSPFLAGTNNTRVATVTATYQPALLVTLPRDVYSTNFNAGMPGVVTITLPHESMVGSEKISWTAASNGAERTLENAWTTEFADGTDGSTAIINRTTKQVTIFFATLPRVGTPIVIEYVRSGYAQSLGSGALSGAFSDNRVEVTPSAGYNVRSARFKIGSDHYKFAADGVLYRDPGGFGAAVAVGAYDFINNEILIVGMPDGSTITNWRCVETNAEFPVVEIIGATIPAGLQPDTVTLTGDKVAGGTFTATADSSGEFVHATVTGTYDKLTGVLDLEFSEEIAAETLEYEGDLLTYTPVDSATAGVNPDFFPTNGEVQAFRTGHIIVVHHTDSLAPQTVVNAQVVNCGRTMLADVRVHGNDGVEIFTGFTVDRAAGEVTFTDVSGYSQPVTVTHRIEDMAVAISVDTAGNIGLSKPLAHNYLADESFVSSAVLFGDMFARAHPGFAQETWTDVWADTPTGDDILADYNEAAHPILMTNEGGLTERWAVIFTNSTAFKIVGEQVGQIAVGSTGEDVSPLNPATGEPYFTLQSEGWGTGWQIGNVYRFNTTGAAAGFWTIRSIKPSDPFAGQDKLAVAMRGSINA